MNAKRRGAMLKNYSVIVPKDVCPKPSNKELTAAYVLMEYFKSDVRFIPRNNCKTPDLMIKRTEWELKAPVGNGKRNMQHTISRALKQSRHIIVDIRFSKASSEKIKNQLIAEVKKNRRIKKLLLIDKKGKVVEIL
ncbi:hypothetical protein IKX64_01765 [Candidatus Saccharibacteria bacterium]|nr:hypothetical protein [Candidatus Saccharibacteria bacterium]